MNALFSEEQVNNLNEFQTLGKVHPFTCCGGDNVPECKRNMSYNRRRNGEEVPYSDENEGVLIATKNGWVCPCGKYTQNWAHDFMTQNQKLKDDEKI
jgi:hypothetical protein